MRRGIPATVFVLAAVLLKPPGLSLAKDSPDMIVFSVRQWQGEYATSDRPGGVAVSPFTSALYLVPADGSAAPRRIVDVAGRGDAPHYSPDGQWIYFQAPVNGVGHIFRCREDGSDLQNLTANHQPPGDRYGCQVSRDGTKVVFVYHDGQVGRVGLMNADGSQPYLIAPDIGYHYMAELSPDNRSVVFAHTARGYVLALKHLDTGEIVTLTPDLPESFCPQFTPDGRTIIFFRRDGDFYRVDTDGGHLQRLTNGCQHAEFRLSPKDEHGSSDPPAISPDGRQIAYTAVADGVPQVQVMDLDGGHQRQVTHRPAACGRLRWSPDGTRLAFVSWVGEYTQLFTVPAPGGEPQQLTDVHGAVYWLDWRPSAAPPQTHQEPNHAP
jgi:Tol biopolymer transport system component